MNSYFKLLRFLKGHRKLFLIAIVTMFFSSFFEIFQISMFVPLIDRMFTNKKMVLPSQVPEFASNLIGKLNAMTPQEMLHVLPLVFIIGIVLKLVISFFYQYLMNLVSQRVMRDIRTSLYTKIHNLSLEYFTNKRTGELISRITNDANVIDNAVSYAIVDLFRQTFTIILCVITAAYIFPKGALIVFIIIPVIGIPMGALGKKLRKISVGTQEKMADINSTLLETISGIRVVKAFCTEKFEIGRFIIQNQQYFKLRMKSIKRLILMSPITELMSSLLAVVIILWLGQSVMKGEISFGFFGLFFGCIMTVISPIKKLSNAYAIIQQAVGASDRIYEVLDAEVVVRENVQAIQLPRIKSKIELKEVNFHYYHEAGLVLKDINLEIKTGEMVAIVGPTGAGKTTVVNLIPRFYDPTDGKVIIDGTDIKNVTFQSLRDQIGIVSQESILFNDTVKANIAYGMTDTSQAMIEAAAKKAFAHDFIMKMPKKYNTVVGDRGVLLSGGEKQRITIARAILRNAPILILDEATSHLDSESEKFIQEALYEFMKDRTVIAIAHRLSTILKADKIVVLENGRMVGMGKHEELMKTCELYQRLYNRQFQV